jgi:hypothetical protein
MTTITDVSHREKDVIACFYTCIAENKEIQTVCRFAQDYRSSLVWRFDQAPAALRDLFQQGGDEDYLAIIPDALETDWVTFNEEVFNNASFGCAHISRYECPPFVILVGTHS